MEGTTSDLPAFYRARIERDLGELYRHLPAGSLMHDPNAYLKTEQNGAPVTRLQAGRARRVAAPVERAAAP
jgi:hypothetical protein